MRSPKDMTCIQVEVTNHCFNSCANCTRFCGLHSKPFYMELRDVRSAIKSLEGFNGTIGLMGGEPAMHPYFHEILQIYRELIPDKSKRELWTSGYKWEEYKDEIYRTFDEERISYNDHSGDLDVRHQPLLLDIEDIVESEFLRWRMVRNCWIQNRWSASITPKGVFFCEVAAAQAHLFDMDTGIPVFEGWWKKPIQFFDKQIREHCSSCSACVPLSGSFPDNGRTLIGPANYERLSERAKKRCEVYEPSVISGGYEIGEPGEETGSFKRFPNWHPWRYRDETRHEPT